MSAPTTGDVTARALHVAMRRLADQFLEDVPDFLSVDFDALPKRWRGLLVAGCAEILATSRSEDQSLAKIIRALDRCAHGRHAADSCVDCPGGHSSGNLNLRPGQRIGTSLGGIPIVVPDDWALRTVAEYWIPKAHRSETYRNGPV